MKILRVFSVILIAVFGIIAVTLFVRWKTNRDSTELILQPSNVEYTRWELPEGAKTRLGKGKVNDIKFSPDGTRFAVATTIGVWMYDAQTGTEKSLFKGHRQDQEIQRIAFSPDGKLIIGAISSGEISRWDADNGEQLSPLPPTDKIQISAVFSADGTKLASVGQPMEGGIHVFNFGENTTQPTITTMDLDFKVGYNTVIALSPDKRTLASTTQPKQDKHFSIKVSIQVFDVDTGDTLFSLVGHNGLIKDLAFSPDGKTLASADYEKIHLWDVDTKTSRATFKAPGTGFSALAFSPNGKLLASGCRDGSVRLWNATAKQQGLGGKIGQFLPTLMLKKHKNEVSALAFSPDGKMLFTGSKNGTIRAWDTTTGKQQFTCREHLDGISDIAASKEGNILTSVHSWRNTQMLHWDIDNRSLLSVSFLKRTIPATISPDVTTLAMMDLRGKNKLKLWDISEKRFRATLEGHEYPSNALNFVFAFSSDGKRLASTSIDDWSGVIHLWDIANPPKSFLKKLFASSKTIKPRYTLEEHTSRVNELAFSPDGKLLVSGGGDRTIHLWEVETGNALVTLTGHNKQITAIAFSPNGQKLVSASYLVIYSWNVETGQLLTKSQPMSTAKILRFSPDGKIVVSGRYDGTIQLWNARTLRLLSTHIGHTSSVNALKFIEDGKTLASASYDGTILLWDWEKIKQENN
ncbi:MAG: WD40 repeat domain-containing protein [Candidatus Poribacteria bacterium]|nr:WD40 repeat domain-containing protein [Candidatus Poribacteria bacterium]